MKPKPTPILHLETKKPVVTFRFCDAKLQSVSQIYARHTALLVYINKKNVNN